ncbi:hypothetical protein [Janthinobacterium sp. PC23-8]|uniref:hypothetical protein n=1 Tax=Janthinobacterium sp. PC23-8 TaxID=2012679 RepID=UPI000B9613C9|nr:hypothetical protein [Janthinobacterium sp. PC23-8]OYO29193.1 hypothetical protein CD932_19050 [Janthinobacterium sp. PC23-8]
MKERPILMNSAMVCATLAGTKTQTRRIIKLPPAPAALGEWQASTIGGENGGRTAAGNEVPLRAVIWHTRTGKTISCPHGQPGDRLWVRETWVCDDFRVQAGPYLEVPGAREALFYRADNEQSFEAPEGKYWKPSIHMPRWASRILLEIVSVRVERLNDCSEADAIAEGVRKFTDSFMRGLPGWEGYPGAFARPDAYTAYYDLWEKINGVGSWDANPWVWVIEFKRVTP